jgi:5-methyltetrahydropteroyltriglutamate--homocysteine methyltransferase
VDAVSVEAGQRTATEQGGPPFRADHVGSLLRPQVLKDAFRDYRGGRIGADAFREIQDRAIREAVALQEEVGLQSITDGEFRRGSWFSGFVEAVEGLTTTASPFDFHGGGQAKFQTAYAEGKLKRVRGITTGEFSFLSACTRRTPKVTIPSPSLVHFLRGDVTVSRDAYPDLDEFWTDLVAVYQGELAELGRLGCSYVQLDEVPCAMLCDPALRASVRTAGQNPNQLLDVYISAANRAITERPAGMTIAMHLCRGNYKGQWMAQGSYEPVAERLFNEVDVDSFFLEYDNERAGGFEPLRFVPANKKVVLGLVSTKTPVLESTDALCQRIDEASRYVPLERLCISPQCGFASSVGGNPLTIDDQRRKLARVVDVAETVWGRS